MRRYRSTNSVCRPSFQQSHGCRSTVSRVLMMAGCMETGTSSVALVFPLDCRASAAALQGSGAESLGHGCGTGFPVNGGGVGPLGQGSGAGPLGQGREKRTVAEDDRLLDGQRMAAAPITAPAAPPTILPRTLPAGAAIGPIC